MLWRLRACAFDLIELDGRDLRFNPLTERRRLLAKLVRKPGAGLVLNAQFEDDGALVFQHTCLLAANASCRSANTHAIVPVAPEIGSR
jgi:ATP-dependent DNA ligase